MWKHLSLILNSSRCEERKQEEEEGEKHVFVLSFSEEEGSDWDPEGLIMTHRYFYCFWASRAESEGQSEVGRWAGPGLFGLEDLLIS